MLFGPVATVNRFHVIDSWSSVPVSDDGCFSSRPHPGLLVIYSLCNRMILGYHGPPSGETTIVLVFGYLPLRGWVGASWLPTMASSFPLPCRIFSPPSYGLIPIIVVPMLLPFFSLWSDAGLRDSSAWSGKPDVSMLRRVPGVPPVILRQHYNLSVFALAFIMWIWVVPRPLPIWLGNWFSFSLCDSYFCNRLHCV